MEKMKEWYECDPDFTAQDFIDSLSQAKINDGCREELKILKDHPAYREHMMSVMRDRIDMAGEYEIYDDRDYVIGGNIPEGVGHEWVKYELKNFRAMYQIPEPSREDYVDEIENEIGLGDPIAEKKEEKKADEKKQEPDRKEVNEQKKPELKKADGLQDNLAGKIYKAMESDQLLINPPPIRSRERNLLRIMWRRSPLRKTMRSSYWTGLRLER